MSSTSETETEILLGNKHLLAIFFVLAILLGIAFTGGYMVGRNSPEKKPSGVTVSDEAPNASSSGASSSGASSSGASSLETHSIPPVGGDQATSSGASPATDDPVTTQKEARPLGAPKQKEPAEAPAAALKVAVKVEAPAPVKGGALGGPESGQTFLQVAALGHTEANAMAEVLNKKGFRAHAVAKPGSELYRVLIGPLRDASELSSTRDSLRNAGFTKIFVQKY